MFGGLTQTGPQAGPEICYFADASPRGRAVEPLVEEIEASSSAGYTLCLVPTQERSEGLHPAIADLARRGKVILVGGSLSGDMVRLAIFHEPCGEKLNRIEGGRILAEKAVVVLHRPIFDSSGKSRIDIAEVGEDVARLTGAAPVLAPAWPSVRRQLEKFACPCPVLMENWAPVIAARPVIGGASLPRGVRPLVGRFAVERDECWPNDFNQMIELFPLSDHFDVRLFGVPGRLIDQLYGGTPSNWVLYPSDSVSTDRFLGELDFFLHAWNKSWPHAMDFGILQALAHGRVPVLPRGFEETFGPAAIYARPGWETIRQVSALHRDPERFEEVRAEGRRWLDENAVPDRHEQRLARLIDGPRERQRAAVRRPNLMPDRGPNQSQTLRTEGSAPKTVIFSATNGIGLGHLTQLLAIAKRLPEDVRPVFATMSQAVSIVRDAGYAAHYFPDYRYTDSRFRDWTRWLETEIGSLIDLYDAKGLIFDGVLPYEGIIRAGARRRQLPMIWVRIPMWKRATWDDSVERAKYFDLVLDTGETAQARNIGARIPYPEKAEIIPPMLLCDESELLERREARARLGLDDRRPAVLLQLGAGNNQELAPLLDSLLGALGRIGDFQVVNAEWLIAEHGLDAWPNLKVLRGFPNALYYRAFDFVVSAVGYNTFHELIAYGIPTLFVPNENVMTDDQLGRARFAEEEGLGFCMRAYELDRSEALLARLADPAERRLITERCRRLRQPNGAEVAARRIVELVGGGATAPEPAFERVSG